jgi:alkyl hydroperoxide reductase subunit F
MALDTNIINTLTNYLQMMEGDVVFRVSAGTDATSLEMVAILKQISELTNRITIQEVKLERTPSFSINKPNEESGIVFAGIPLGHEFTSLVLAILQVSGRKPKITDEQIAQIKAIEGSFKFETYISLSCHNCPDVVQALNLLSVLNPNISHTMIDGGVFQKEVEEKQIMAVPSVFLNGQLFGNGRMSLEEILSKVDTNSSERELSALNNKEDFDVLIVGGGPAGASAAIYAARKGIKTGLVADRFGGQVMDTLGIENFISVKETEGPKLVKQLEEHVKTYEVDLMTLQRAAKITKEDKLVVELENGAKLRSKAVIIATGAKWRELGVPGEQKFRNKGVAYCPHCDGPLFKGKKVAVVGGGNSGVEAAIDLAGIVEEVTLLEFGSELKADAVLQKRLNSLSNVKVITNAQTTEVTGIDKVNGISYKDRISGNDIHIQLEGIFVQIGLVPNTGWLKDTIDLTKFGEIVVDSHGATSLPGVYAAGDCTNTPYKQIIIAMGSGANASLGAFDYLIRS